jgi:hypothetical protein
VPQVSRRCSENNKVKLYIILDIFTIYIKIYLVKS